MTTTDSRQKVYTRARNHNRKGHVLLAALAACIATAGGLVVFVSSASKFEAPASVITNELSDEAVVASALVDAGVSPESLAVAGLTGQEASPVIDAAITAAESRIIPIRTSLENKAAAIRSYTELRRGGDATAQQLAAAKEAVNQATQTHASLVALVRAPAVALLDTDEVRRLDAHQANHSRKLPLQYKAYKWSSSEVMDIMQASQQKAADESRGDAVDPDAVSILNQADLNTDVAVAANSLTLRLQAIRVAWDAAING
ncbi:MAG: hypothetical protein ED559_06260 [Phycisphaera sp.]|nr:MAG: hypothetical protein ED559_06260 [Phycisphaera sp.]